MTEFSLQLRGFEKLASEQMDVVVQKLTWEAFSRIVRMSPVRTGAFRNSWRIGLDAIDNSVGQAGPDMSNAYGLSALFRIRAGGIINVSNSLPYATQLEFGSSQQAPGGMVRIVASQLQTFRIK